MPYDYSKLKGRIVEMCGTRREFARRMGISEVSISNKLRGVNPWRQDDIYDAMRILNIPPENIFEYFFRKR